MNDSIRKRFEANSDVNVFVMMRYGESKEFQEIETTVKETLAEYGLDAQLAKNTEFNDDLWRNVQFYLDNCKYGIVIYEEILGRDFNPNISIEMGYMYGQGKDCLILKDKSITTLPTDICGKIYRSFDTYSIEASISEQIKDWCENKLGLTSAKTGTWLDKYFESNFHQLVGKLDQQDKTPDHLYYVDGWYSSGPDFSRMAINWDDHEKRFVRHEKSGQRRFRSFVEEVEHGDIDKILTKLELPLSMKPTAR